MINEISRREIKMVLARMKLVVMLMSEAAEINEDLGLNKEENISETRMQSCRDHSYKYGCVEDKNS